MSKNSKDWETLKDIDVKRIDTTEFNLFWVFQKIIKDPLFLSQVHIFYKVSRKIHN